MENNSEIRHQQQSSDEILLLCDEGRSRVRSLEQLLYDTVSNAVKELCFEYKTERKNNPSSEDTLRPKLFVSIQRPDEADIEDLALGVVDERKQLGKKIKNHVTGEKVLYFDIPEDFDVEGIKNIEEIKDRLGKWRIQRRQRHSKMNDTYYYHLASRQTCWSVPEVLNFIIYGPRHKISASDIASTSQGDNMELSKTLKKHRKDEEKQVSTSQESLWSPSSESTILSNLELSLVPWTPLDSEMNMYYWHLSPTQSQLNPQPLSILPYEPQSSICRDIKKAILIHEKENFVDLTKDSDDENETYSNWEITEVAQDKVKSISSSEPPPLKNLMDMNLLEMLDDYTNIMGNISLVDLLGESNDNVVTLHTNQKEVGKEKQALIITDEAVESFTITEIRNKKNQNLQENSGPAVKFSTLEEAKKKLACVELEGVVDDDDHFQHGVHFSKPDPVNHLLDYDYDYYYDDVIDLLFRD